MSESEYSSAYHQQLPFRIDLNENMCRMSIASSFSRNLASGDRAYKTFYKQDDIKAFEKCVKQFYELKNK